MTPNELRERTKAFALRVIKLVSSLPRDAVGDVLGRQLLRAGTSIGANYREASRASTGKQFLYSMQVVLREADESLYWLELIADAELVKPSRLEGLHDECNQLVSIFVASVRTSRRFRK